MKKTGIIIAIIAGTLTSAAQNVNIPATVKDAEAQTAVMLREIAVAKQTDNKGVSPRTLEDGKLKLVASRDWTSGFFPGELWYLYELSGNKKWETTARAFTADVEQEKTNGTTHDMGFKVYCSVGNGYRLTKDPHYKNVIIQAAQTLSKRFNPVAGVLRSWDHSKNKWDFPVIIDNMMNLELLFEAWKLTGDRHLYQVAVGHADQTMKNHFRPDYSSYHVVDYDTVTGKINKKTTHQGYANESAWARGQSWGLYGYTICYRETKDAKYLKMAENIAGFILHHPNLPKDGVPYWDFNAPGIPDEPRDASAAAVIASALYELSTYSKHAKTYRAAANRILSSLTKTYRAPIGTASGFLLLHSTGTKLTNTEVDEPLSYADYYYLEALLRQKRLRAGKKLF
ncbi:glycoside hydrolase family 88 protein [Niabella sp. CC-SYL272]|uniref:glycoside hydrolase family 88 protein n=1 Tax=Niabella agricola TaxID=2891571 RepID=UPI001F3F3574|nr:glycoside hydrolase family 88 protein [Niabella agricola]MCF3111820.1 glycoside hydrolase family 88 protein [Niabella agricola]